MLFIFKLRYTLLIFFIKEVVKDIMAWNEYVLFYVEKLLLGAKIVLTKDYFSSF